MKKTMMKVVAVATLAGVFTGCTSVRSNDGANQVKAEMIAPKYEAVVTNKSTKISGSANINSLLGITWGDNRFAECADLDNGSAVSRLLPIPDSLKKVKQAATYNACTENRADFLIAAKYEITEKDYVIFKKITCTVKGFPGYVKGVKQVKDAPKK